MTLFAANLLLITVRESECQSRVLRESLVWFVIMLVGGLVLAGGILFSWDLGWQKLPSQALRGPAWACLAGLGAHGTLYLWRDRMSALLIRVLADWSVIVPGIALWLWL